MAKITSLAELTDVASDDLLVVVDKSDTSMSDSGTDKKVQKVNLLKGLVPENGWTPAGETWTYASATTFTISGDKTGKYQKGDKIKLTQTTDKFFSVIGVSYSSPNTTVTVTGGSDYSLANATITSPYFSKIENPQGFPPSFGISGTNNRFTIRGSYCHLWGWNYITGNTNNQRSGIANFGITFSSAPFVTCTLYGFYGSASAPTLITQFADANTFQVGDAMSSVQDITTTGFQITINVGVPANWTSNIHMGYGYSVVGPI